MKPIDNILKLREYVVGSVRQDASVSEMVKLVADTEVGAFLVLEAGRLVGIAIEGERVRKMVLTGRSFQETQVWELMAHNVIYASPEQIVEKCLALTQEKQVRHLPVMSYGHLIGIISMGDLARTMISDQEDQIPIAPGDQ